MNIAIIYLWVFFVLYDFTGNQLSSLRSRIPSKVNELIDNGKDYAKSNPLTFLTIVALVLSCSLPVLVFLAFAIITVAVTFIGFLFVEGDFNIAFYVI